MQGCSTCPRILLLGETNIPDRKNYDIAELGLSVEAAKNLYTGRVNAEVVNLLLENARFAELTLPNIAVFLMIPLLPASQHRTPCSRH